MRTVARSARAWIETTKKRLTDGNKGMSHALRVRGLKRFSIESVNQWVRRTLCACVD